MCCSACSAAFRLGISLVSLFDPLCAHLVHQCCDHMQQHAATCRNCISRSLDLVQLATLKGCNNCSLSLEACVSFCLLAEPHFITQRLRLAAVQQPFGTAMVISTGLSHIPALTGCVYQLSQQSFGTGIVTCRVCKWLQNWRHACSTLIDNQFFTCINASSNYTWALPLLWTDKRCPART